MSVKVNLLFLLMLLMGQMFGQKLKPYELVKSQNQFVQKSLFDQSARSKANVPEGIKNYDLMDLDREKVAFLLNSADKAIVLDIPTTKRSALKLKLVEIEMPEFSVTAAPSGEKIKFRKGKHYQGIVDGQPNSMVALSVFDNEVMGFISEERSETVLAIGKLKGEETHIIYDESQVSFANKFECLVKDSDLTEEFTNDQLFKDNNDRALTDCVRLYFEVDNDIFNDKGQAGTTSYITAVFNQLKVLYGNENINISLGAIVIWTTASPYTGGDPNALLTQFNNYRNGFDGDLGMLVSYKTSGGIAWVNGLCNPNKDFSSGFVRINSTFSNVPAYSWTLNGLAHEFGHLFGSPHTQKCAWNGNNTALDGCYAVEGSCPRPSNNTVSAFTIMSYCHLNGTPPNFNAGFGPQPGNLIRSKVSAANCLGACSSGGGGSPSCSDGIKNGQETGIDCGGPSCQPCSTCSDGIKNGQETGVDCGGPNCAPCTAGCTTNAIQMKVVTDYYPTEFTWRIKNTAGAILFTGSGYSVPLATYTSDFCLPNGCYNLEVFDAYGDGICCNFGNGSFALLYNNTTLTSGGQFGSSQIKNFCVNGSTPTPTCTDGIKNGQETGVDCGGPSCPACATCNDGIKNGQETGIDCGGPTCGPCAVAPTCTDGVKNGQETGIDCGGPTCSPCAVAPTCTDGIKNGQETGIDCGGPTCSPCAVAPTCTDGVKNGQETGVDCGGPTCSPCAVAPTCSDGIKNGQETGVDCGGPTCAPCSTPTCINGVLTVVLDKYPTETSWQITSGSGQILYSGGGYSVKNSTQNINLCLAPGTCFNFKIVDAYGDGICCSQGAGSYKIVFNNTTLISGGQFGTTETKQFCIPGGGGTPTPTCSDGIKNGQETGIDCGGPTCSPCSVAPTCSDGIKNGQETGIDCGGPTCSPCAVAPTCSDGVKNGQETGVDCGGPSCAPCNTNTCINGVVTLVTDQFPQETSWKITNSSGQTLYTGGSYVSPNNTYTQNICLLPSQCYNFIINDGYGDGICCSYGNGSFKVVVNGNTLTSGGQFGITQTKQFCMPAASLESGIMGGENQYSIYPNPTNDLLHVSIKNIDNPEETIKFEVFDLMGRLVKKSTRQIDHLLDIDTGDLNQGTYILRLSGENQVLYHDRFQVIK